MSLKGSLKKRGQVHTLSVFDLGAFLKGSQVILLLVA